jgi:hypothetical protein
MKAMWGWSVRFVPLGVLDDRTPAEVSLAPAFSDQGVR